MAEIGIADPECSGLENGGVVGCLKHIIWCLCPEQELERSNMSCKELCNSQRGGDVPREQDHQLQKEKQSEVGYKINNGMCRFLDNNSKAKLDEHESPK